MRVSRRVAWLLSIVLVTSLALAVSPPDGSAPLAPPAAEAEAPPPVRPAAVGLLPSAGQFVPLTPAQIVTGRSIPANQASKVSVRGVGGIPADADVAAVAVSLSASSTVVGQLVAYPTGTTRPTTANLHFRANKLNRAFSVVKTSANGELDIYNLTSAAATVDVAVEGYWLSAASSPAQSTFVPLTTTRLDLDPNSSNQYATVADNTSAAFPVLGVGGVPSSGVSAVVLNVSGRASASPGYLTAYADGAALPSAPMVQYETANVYKSNLVVSKVGSNGQVRIYHNHTSSSTTPPAATVVAEVVGYFTTPQNVVNAGSTFVPITPTRVTSGASLAGQSTATVAPLELTDIPDSGVSAVAMTVTANAADSGTQSAVSSFLVVHPSGTTAPAAPWNLAYEANQGYFNGPVTARLGSDGKVSIYNRAANTSAPVRIWVDVFGYFKAPTAPAAPTTVKATSGDGEAAVTWTASSSDGGATIASYTVTASPGGKTATVQGDQITATVTGLTNNTAYTFTVKAKNAVGESPASTASNRIVPLAPGALYAHDNNGRVTAVFDGSGAGSRISHDAAGNITEVTALPATTLAVAQVAPAGAAPGDTVSIYGTNFGNDKTAVTVTFNGTPATPTTVDRNLITVAVPAGATTGDIDVTVAGVTKTWTGFRVTAAPPAPVVSLNGIRVADAGSALTISGTGFDPDRTRNLASINGTRVQVTAATSTSLTLKLPPEPVFGRVTVVSRGSAAESSGYVVVPPSPYPATSVGTGEAVHLVPGTVSTVPVNTAEHVAVALFDVPAGSRGMVYLSGDTFTDTYDVRLIGPDHTVVTESVAVNAYLDLPYDAPPGTYAVMIDPRGTNTGTVQVHATTSPDAKAGLTIDGPEGTATTSAAGGYARFSFTGNQGDKLFARVASDADGFSVGVLDERDVEVGPSKSFLGRDGYYGPTTLPAKGTYTLLVNPSLLKSGTYRATVTTVPADATATAVVDGAAAQLTIAKPGQNGVVTFNGAAGQRVFIAVQKSPSASRCVWLSLLAPDGSEVDDRACMESGGGRIDAVTLPTSGTYRIPVDPIDDYTGAFTVTVTSVPADPVATAVIDGAAGQFNTTKPGQNGSVSFTATAGQQIFTKVERLSGSGTGCRNVTLFAPDDSQVLPPQCHISAVGFIDALTLTQAGTYRFLVDPPGEEVGTYKVTVTSVPPDASVPATIGGPPVTVTTTKPGQNSKLTFSGTAGQNVTFTVTSESYTNASAPRASLCPPSGTCASLMSVSTGQPQTRTLAATGTYTVAIDPNQDDVGSATFQLTQAAHAAPEVKKTGDGHPFEKMPSPQGDPNALTGVKRAEPRLTYVAPARRASASLLGVVRTTNGAPLPGLTVGVASRQARTNAQGRFELRGLPLGRHLLRLDGRTASGKRKTYGVFEAHVHLKEGANRLHYTPYLPVLDTDYEVPVDFPLKRPLVVTNPAIPGLELHLPAGATVLDADGKPARRIGITSIPVDRTPIPMPEGVQVPIYFTVQPAGGKIVGGAARLVYPNYLKLRPGQQVNFWHYQTGGNGWQIYGAGQVDRAGRKVVPAEGTVIYDFAGAMINTPGMPEGILTFLLKFLNLAGDPVELSSGLFSMKQTDLTVDDVIPLELTRGYNSGDGRERPMGMGSNDFYNMFMSSRRQYQEADLNFPDGARVHFVRISPGTSFCDAVFEARDSSPEFYQARMQYAGGQDECTVNDGLWHLRLRNGLVYVMGNEAPLQEIRDSQGNRVQILRKYKNTFGSYIGPITNVRSPNGAWLRYTHETCDPSCATPKVLKVEDNAGRSVSYTYEGDLLKTVTDPNGGVTEYGYDGSGRMNSIKDARNKAYLTNVYDANGRVRTQTLLGEGTYTFDYELSSDGKRVLSTTVTEPDGVRRKTTYDDKGYLVSDTRALGTANEYTVGVSRDPATELPTQATDGFGRTTSVDYDAAGNPKTFGATAGTKSVSARATYNNTPYGQPDTVTDANNNTTRLEYDNAGNITKLTDPRNSAWTAKYNPQGQVTETKSPLGLVSKHDYVDGLLMATTDPIGRKTRFVYDGAGRVVETIAPDGTSTKTTYDAANVVKSTTDAEGNTLVFDHDENGNVLSVTDARNNTTRYEYDDADRLVKRTDPLGAYETFEYDPMGRLKLHTDRCGKITEYRYDELGRTKLAGFGKTGPDVFESTLTYAYDTRGRLKTVADSTPGAGTITYDYDDLDRVTKESGPQGDITYGYDDGGRLRSMTASGEEPVTYDYYPNDLLWKVNRGAITAEYTYDPDGRLTTKTLPGGITETNTYDEASRLKEITYEQGSAFAGNVTYTFDKLGRRTKVAGTLAEATLPQPASGMVYDAANRLTTFGGQTLDYDAAGNLTADGTNTYQWNARSQLVSVDEGASTSTLRYDPLGRRTSSTVAGLTTGFRLDGDELIGQTGSDGTDSVFLNGLGHDETLARFDATGTANAYLRDALGSTLALTNGSGQIQTSYGYDLFGNTSEPTPTDSNPIRWTGRVSGPTMPAGLQDNRARLYSPKLMRFISEDPVGFEGGYNLYEYAAGDPVDLNDPDGTTPVHAGGIVGACLAGGTVNTTAGWLLGRKHGAGDFARGFAKGCGEGVLGFATGSLFKGYKGLRLARTGVVDDLAIGLRRVGRTSCSFDGATPVLMADGTKKPISQIRYGDEVLAEDPATGRQDARKVTAVWAHRDSLAVLVVGGETIVTTMDHPFWDPVKKRWLAAGSLELGDGVLSADGRTLRVRGTADSAEQSKMAYNLTVEGIHTYFVSDAEILVHNVCGSIESAAQALVALNGGKNRVFVRTPSGAFSLDLAGKAHFDKATGQLISTPHVKLYTKHTGPGGRVSYTAGVTRPATWDDIRLARAYLERK